MTTAKEYAAARVENPTGIVLLKTEYRDRAQRPVSWDDPESVETVWIFEIEEGGEVQVTGAPAASATLTPYDTGERLEPIRWTNGTDTLDTEPDRDRWGKVDFENAESQTAVCVWVEPGPGGKVIVHVQVLGADGALVEVMGA